MRPFLEVVQNLPDSSWSMLNRRLDDAIPFQWHHHPEYELTMTLNSRGHRFIGDHVGEYGDDDLVLIGQNLPHTWSSREKINPNEPHVALVVKFHSDWVTRTIDPVIEHRSVAGLLARAAHGLHFRGETAAQLRGDYEKLFQQEPVERLFTLLRILHRLAQDTDSNSLSSAAASQQREGESRERIDRILNHIHAQYMQKSSIDDLADIAALSASGLHRLFRKHTQMTVSDYIARLRIGDACARLSGTSQPIAFIADAVGYATLANFNRQFKSQMSMTPRDYRSRFLG